ncbi:TetR/AcrR family transcriptional regulator [Desulforegula conservatrix]|uniref:TetR/AcrR family transcriptional regulator n=1 Tax=Desulforegula conservatrix TaxID=153026 RepID=UPI0022B45C2B|nr:TetR/AcrR family transcriptional regulator [Desulforegula conservatrix]
MLEAAIRIFARNGFFSSTISQIAKEAGVADGTIYLYFKNKDDILLQFFSYKAKEIFDGFWMAVDEGKNSVEKLRNLVKSHLAAFQSDIDMAMVFQSETKGNHQMRDQLNEMTRKYLSALGDILEQGQDEGLFSKELYMGLTKRFILGAVNEVINTWVSSGGKYDLVSMGDPLVNLVINGIGAGEKLAPTGP